MKKMSVILIFCLILVGCSTQEASQVVKEKPVVTQVIEAMSYPVELTYYGIVEPTETVKYAFLSGGVLEDVSVKVGDQVAVGDHLARLDDKNLVIAADTTEQQKRAAALDYEKAKKSQAYYQDLYNDQVALLEAGATSSHQVEQVKLSLDIANQELSQAYAVYQQSVIKGQYDANNVTDALMVADRQGVVLDVLSKQGEVVAPGYPVVVLRSLDHSATVGLTALDLKKVSLDTAVRVIDQEGGTSKGVISKISQVPDQASRTYAVEINVPQGSSLLVGEVVTVVFDMGQARGVWLSATHVLNDGRDYVYIVSEGRAYRRDITLVNIHEDHVLVDGILEGEIMVVKGANTLSDGYLVKDLGGDKGE